MKNAAKVGSVLLDKEGITIEKYPVLYELEARHDVDLGLAYKTTPSAMLTATQHFHLKAFTTTVCSV